MMEKVEVYEVVKVTEEVEICYNEIQLTTPKKRKSKAQEDRVEKMKKPRSAYLLYYFDVHQILQKEVPNLPQSEINKRISESWKRLSVAEKGHYLEKARSEKEGISTSSISPSKDLPGFRKILPRASFLSKGCPLNRQLAGFQSEVAVESLDPPAEGGLPLVSIIQDPQFPNDVLASEVELSEQPIVVDNIGEEMAVVSCPMTLQEIPPSSSSSITSSVPVSTEVHVSQGLDDLRAAGITLKESKTGVAGNGFGGTMVQQIQGETTQVVAIIPAQSLQEPKSLAGVSSVGPVMMVSVGASVEQSAKPSYKMSVKTYTRRGRGRCLNPGCSFVYVTRHKPPTCPECGNHLGGKWIPIAKKAMKTLESDATTKQLLQKAETKAIESCQPTPPPAQEENADASKKHYTENKRERRTQQFSRKQHAVPTGKPPEGRSTKQQEPTKQLKDGFKSTIVQGQDRSNPTVQKRPVRPILPAYTGRAFFQIVTVPPNKGKLQHSDIRSSTESFSGLKPSTLKQLGYVVRTTTTKQDSPVLTDGSQSLSSGTDRRVNILSVVPLKQHTVSSFDLGLSTARGRGRCKNPSCDYMYKNRHKPAVCPKCSCELTQKSPKEAKALSGTLLDPYQALSPVQRDIQRQNTIQLLRHSVQIPESETELQETLLLIQELNSFQIVWVQPSDQEHSDIAEMETLIESQWPQFYESAATHCVLCNFPLFKGGPSTVAGQEDCWLLTETLLQTVSLQLKVCLNVQCLALHSFTDLHPGLFNVGNRLLVSIDLFLKIRASIKLGHPPSQAARTALDHIPNHPVHSLSPEEFSQIQELLLSGYWAFECLTVRDYNDMICGICGVAPKLEIAQRDNNSVLELKNVEFTWPEVSVSDEVHMDDFWLTMESEAIEQAAFPTDIPITRVDASIIAPFIPPLMRSPTVINTEKDKVLSHAQQPSGDPSVLVRLIHDGQLRLDKIKDHTEDELRTILERCGATITPGSSKNELLASLVSLYTVVHSGLSTAPQPPPHLTAGKLSKVCPHKVVCGSKYLVRGETARDHVDLLLSSRYWPPVYVSDCARQVALCTDMQYPELATQMWGRNQGCFSDPFEKPVFVSCVGLQNQPCSADLSLLAENQQLHPITKSSCCWLIHPPGMQQSLECSASPLEHHSMSLCRDLEPYVSMVAELEKKREEEKQEEAEEKEQTVRAEKDSTERSENCSSVNCAWQRPIVFNNTAYYYLYNRLVDFLASRDIVNQQVNQVVKACQPGEVVIRDALYLLGVAQISTVNIGDEGSETEGQTQAGGTETHEAAQPESSDQLNPQAGT